MNPFTKLFAKKPGYVVDSRGGTNRPEERGFSDLAATGSKNTDWRIENISDDADLWFNAYLLTARVRDLFKTNPIFVKYRELLWANVFGSNGIMLRMKIKETEDRVVHSEDEKSAIRAHERRINQLRKHAATKAGTRHQKYRLLTIADRLERAAENGDTRSVAKILMGEPDIYANLRVEAGWDEWQRAEFCDLRGKRNYKTLRQLRLINAVRDGDVFVRQICGPKVNKFGFSLQLIPAEWCDRFYNDRLPNGNVVVMGIEYEMTAWGLGKPVAYYFIKRQPRDWQFTIQRSMSFGGGNVHQRIDASEIIHYARPVDAEATRPAPWVASTIPSARQLDQAMLAEVIAWRESACKTGFLESDLPAGGVEGIPVDLVTLARTIAMAPGDIYGLPAGVKFKERDPKHPNSNVESMRKVSLRNTSAGMPAGDYNTLANDLENINFSAGRLGRLDTNEMSKLLQEFDIQTAEMPIFERFLEMSLMTGAIPLPASKYDKFNKPVFQGRRWAQVDENKAVDAAAKRIANKLSSRSKECAEEGIDFEDNAFELAQEDMLLEQLGLRTETTAQDPQPAAKDDEDKPSDADKPKPEED